MDRILAKPQNTAVILPSGRQALLTRLSECSGVLHIQDKRGDGHKEYSVTVPERLSLHRLVHGLSSAGCLVNGKFTVLKPARSGRL